MYLIKKLMEEIAEMALKELEKLDSYEKQLSDLLAKGKRNTKGYITVISDASYSDGYVSALHTVYLMLVKLCYGKDNNQ